MIRKMSDRCVCGHDYGDHTQRGHRCTEASILRPSHACSCEEFRLPTSHVKWDVSLGDVDVMFLAARSGAEQAQIRELRGMDVQLGNSWTDASMADLIE